MKKRKTNRAKKVSSQCRNNGSCPWCRGNRTFSTEKRSLFDEIMEGFNALEDERNERLKD
jgi:uncharacterized protein YabN with tetrapyrrole methylase and pyrophosphatase domain